MLQKPTPLPPLDYFLAFESAAKFQSFVGAAKELHISETAISRKVRLLELHFKIPLFLRGHRSITLTPQGAALLDKVQPALQMLRKASRDIVAEHQKSPVTLAATNSVAALWLMPRLQKLNRSNKQLKIMLVASDNDAECLADTVDLSILRGDGNWPGYHAERLFGETIFPVCSPQFLTANPGVASLDTLPDHTVIEVSSAHREWMNWKTWLAHNDIADPALDQSVAFNSYPLSIHAAVEGLGVALGWGHLVDHLLDSGALVRPMDDVSVRTDHGYFLLKSVTRDAFPEREIVENWLLTTSAARRKYRAGV